MMSESAVNNPAVAFPLSPVIRATANVVSNHAATTTTTTGREQGVPLHNEMTLYDKLNHLSNLIELEMVMFHTTVSEDSFDVTTVGPLRDSYTNTILRREEIQKVINDIKDSSFKERSPEASYNIRLFNRYREMVNAYTGSHQLSPVKPTHRYSIFGELPTAMFEFDDDHLLVGQHAIRTKICKMRVANAVLSLIAFSIMASVPFITEDDFCVTHHFQGQQCSRYRYIDGCFNFRPFQLVIAVGVLVFIGNSAAVVYYMLPIDNTTAEKVKYIPGLLSLLNDCRSSSQSREQNALALKSFSMRLRTHWRLIELIVDGILFALSMSAFIASVVVLGIAQELVESNVSHFYTLHTIYLTFSSSCLSGMEDPSSRIQASLWMLFFSLLCSLLSCLIAWRAYRDDSRLRMSSRVNSTVVEGECKAESTVNEYTTLPQAQRTADDMEAKL